MNTNEPMSSDSGAPATARRFAPGDITWAPAPGARPRMRDFMEAANARHGLMMSHYRDLHRWSVEEASAFWEEVVRYFEVLGDGLGGRGLEDPTMPGAAWFTGARLNFAENVLRHAAREDMADSTAILRIDEDNQIRTITWSRLADQVGSLAAALRRRGVGSGDVVAAVMPNVPEAVIGLLATASLGAIWSINSPDMSAGATLDRISQLAPKVLIGIDGYRFKGRTIDLTGYFAQVAAGLPETGQRLFVKNVSESQAGPEGFEELGPLLHGSERVGPRRLPFDHPLWVLFSSGTTGAPKGIVHSHGGMTLEAHKGIGLQQDLGPGDRYYVAANTSWMVWNTLVNSLTVGASVVTYDGSPAVGGAARQFEILALTGATMFATGAAYLSMVEKSGLEPGTTFDLSALRRIMSTGSPLPPSTWSWVHEAVKADVHLGSDSGGTDICSGFLGSNPMDPVRLGELQGACLGAAVEAWSPSGERVLGELGEMVVTAPMPSMPASFWNDPDGQRYRDAYFDQYPGVWRHGDWITETEHGSFMVHGRSDATLNKNGVRLGTADIYAVVEDLEQIRQSLVIGVEIPGGDYYMPLFVELSAGVELDEELVAELKSAISKQTSARHVPDEIVVVPGIPMSHTNKRLEVPIKRLFLGFELDRALNVGSVANPQALDWFVERARAFGRDRLGAGN
ncbi:acetoacetate--CoA ligase [Paeniglutamicibacter cryotolerans]|uniref:Acetoacetyl-CoA synthetase n=1 Tax=Paeniglutamicibacter cryotolerans TaxID=670079 RepID=A0A839QJE5_9MICC|nr:acetoacetate--CoA ligase [Paeniglutamicibacter cryotolerans]MBB2995937.1 acetoacetyl-CoA synthetase [Paeniglutamicibacter cryotolerans]